MWLQMHSMGLLLSGSVPHMVPPRSQLAAAACQRTRRPLPLHIHDHRVNSQAVGLVLIISRSGVCCLKS